MLIPVHTELCRMGICATDNKCKSQKIVRDIKIYKYLPFEIYINSTKFTSLPVDHNLLNKRYYLDNIFLFISNLSLCGGFAVKLKLEKMKLEKKKTKYC